MAVGNVGARSLLLTKSLVSMRSQLGDLQRQLATGKRADTYAGATNVLAAWVQSALFIGDRYESGVARIVAVLCAIFVSFVYVAGQSRVSGSSSRASCSAPTASHAASPGPSPK